MVSCDATFLSLLFHEKAEPPYGKDGKPVEAAKERIDHQVKLLNKDKAVLLIPTPALSELLTILDEKAIPAVLNEISKSSRFKVVAFDQKAAIEAALMTRAAISEGRGKKDALQASIWSKIKFDRQIMAIAKASGADILYSDDPDMLTHGKRAGIQVIKTEDLPIPPDAEIPPIIRAIQESEDADKKTE